MCNSVGNLVFAPVISASCLDKNVCIPSIQEYFSEDAWAALTHVLEVVRKNAVWYILWKLF